MLINNTYTNSDAQDLKHLLIFYISLIFSPRTFHIDTNELEQRFKALQRRLHPDRFHLKSKTEQVCVCDCAFVCVVSGMCMRMYVHVSVYVRMHVNVYVRLNLFARVYVRVRMCMCPCMSACVCAIKRACLRACVHVCMQVCVCILILVCLL